MKGIKLSALLLALCLLLCACMQPGDTPNRNDPSVSDDQQTIEPDQNTATKPNDEDPDNGETSQIVYPADLTLELVVEWEIADGLLSHLDELADRLHAAVEEAGCPLDRVTLTISTAGGFTAQALIQGGIDAAILPAEDIITYEKRTSIIALSGEAVPQTAISVSLANDDLSEEFRLILFRALTETQAGQDFLSVCCGDAVFSTPSDEALQAVRDYLAELEEAEGGHMQ